MTWEPGHTLLVSVVGLWLIVYWFARSARAWLTAYVVGAVGFTLLTVYLVRGTVVQQAVQAATAVSVHHLSNLLGIPTRVFFDSPGTLLVLIVYQRQGWTAIDVDIECSGLLEMSVFAGLILFLIGLPRLRWAMILVGGLVATFAMNVIRMTVIAIIIHSLGKESIYLAHSLIGRALFFAMIVALYWYTFTRATLSTVRERIVD